MSERAVRTITPPVDIYETDKTYVLIADMPGVPPDGLEVVAEGDELIVRGRVERPAQTPDYQEFELGDYYRAFSLTEDLDAGGITATLRDGVLRIADPQVAADAAEEDPGTHAVAEARPWASSTRSVRSCRGAGSATTRGAPTS